MLTNKDKEVKIAHIPFPEGENKINMRNFVADYSKFNRFTRWSPRVKFDEALKRTIEFYLESEAPNHSRAVGISF